MKNKRNNRVFLAHTPPGRNRLRSVWGDCSETLLSPLGELPLHAKRAEDAAGLRKRLDYAGGEL